MSLWVEKLKVLFLLDLELFLGPSSTSLYIGKTTNSTLLNRRKKGLIMSQIYCSHCFETAINATHCSYCDDSVCRACSSECFRKPEKLSKSKARKARKAPKKVIAKPVTKPAPAPIAPKVESLESSRSDWSLAGVLLAAAVAVRLHGYDKTSESYSTKNRVTDFIRDGFLGDAEDKATVQLARDWYGSDILGSDSDYATKLRSACEKARGSGEVHERDMGFIVSMIPCALRWDARRQRQESRTDPVFAGIAGARGRQDLGKVKVETVREFAQYDSWLVKATVVAGSALGARVSWFSKDQLEVGFETDLRAKVKSHNEQYGETQVSHVQLR